MFSLSLSRPFFTNATYRNGRPLLPIFALLLLIGCNSSHSQLNDDEDDGSFEEKQEYVNGKAFCEKYGDITKLENGFYVKVPKNYDDPMAGTTEIYAHTAEKFDENKPTFVLFTGGPGQHSHVAHRKKMKFYKSLGFNFLLFDQRGIGCSRPEKEEDYFDSDFYSSLNVALDLNEIRKHLGIERISIYGASYGTVPATIYSSVFPEHVRGTVLEGVVFDGFDGQMSSQYGATILQDYYSNLSNEIKERLVTLVDKGVFGEDGINEIWFPMYIKAFAVTGGKWGLEALTDILKNSLFVDDDKVVSKFWSEWEKRYDSSESQGDSSQEITDDGIVNPMILCKEFGATVRDSSDFYIFENGRFSRGAYNSYIGRCEELGFVEERSSTYNPTNFPVKNKITYFQGELDLATLLPGAEKHFKLASSRDSQFIMLSGGGHMPIGIIHDKAEKEETLSEQVALVKKFFVRALNGKQITSAEVENFNNSGDFQFKLSNKK